MGKVFGQKLLMGKVFGQTPPTPGGGLLWSLVGVNQIQPDPSQTYVSPFRIPVSPMGEASQVNPIGAAPYSKPGAVITGRVGPKSGLCKRIILPYSP